MKTASKVFLILTIISSATSLLGIIVGWDSFVYILAEIAAESQGVTLTSQLLAQVMDAVAIYKILLIVSLAVPVVVSIIALVKLKKAQCKSDLTAIAIITLIFANILSGIFMLCIKDEDL